MYAFLLRIPAWLRVTLLVVGGALLFTALVPVTTTEPTGGLQLVGALGLLGALAGVVLPVLVPEIGLSKAVAGHLTREERGEALRASLGGPTPGDPAVRTAAHALAVSNRDDAERRWRWFVGLSVAGAALYVLIALATTVWWLLAAALFVALPAYGLQERRRAARRVEQLEAAGAGSGGS